MENKYKSVESLIEDAIDDLKRTRTNRISKSERFKSYNSKWNTLFFITNIGTIIAILVTYTNIEASELSIFITNSFSIYLILLQYFLSTLDYSARALKLHYEQLEINELRMQLKLLLVSERSDKATEFRHLFEKYSISLKNNENHDAYDDNRNKKRDMTSDKIFLNLNFIFIIIIIVLFIISIFL